MALYRVELMDPKKSSRRSVKFVRADSRDAAVGIAVRNLTKWKMSKYRITNVAQSTKEDYGVDDNPRTRLKPNRLTPVSFTVKGKRHTGKAKLVGGKVKVYVTANMARKINPGLGPLTLLGPRRGGGLEAKKKGLTADKLRAVLAKKKSLDDLFVWQEGKSYPGQRATDWLSYNNYLRGQSS